MPTDQEYLDWLDLIIERYYRYTDDRGFLAKVILGTKKKIEELLEGK